MCHHPTSGAHYQREYHTCIAATGKASIGGDGDENKDYDDDDDDNQNQRTKNTKSFSQNVPLFTGEIYGVDIWSGMLQISSWVKAKKMCFSLNNVLQLEHCPSLMLFFSKSFL